MISPAMFRKILRLFRGGGALISGTGKLPEGEGRLVTLGDPLAGKGVDLLLCRVGGKLYALDAHCPHEDGRIEGGPLVEGKYAVCPVHNYQFDPTSGKPVNAVCPRARTYSVTETEEGARVEI